MIDLIDFNDFEVDPLVFYGGHAGQKKCILDESGDRWMLKFPEPTARLNGNIASYSTSPVSEWLGSHIYASLGLPVHETALGFFNEKVVCACKDFTYPGKTPLMFDNLKGSLSDQLPNFSDRPSDGRSLKLSDILAAIDSIDVPIPKDAMRERFWDMFVVDAFIGNADRSNENWGLLVDEGRNVSLAPVYDNGNAFFNKRRGSKLEERLHDESTIAEDASLSRSCFCRGDGHRISPLKYIASGMNENCNAALLRFIDRVDMAAVGAIIDSLPEEVLSFAVMPSHVKEFHKKVLGTRLEKYFEATAEMLTCKDRSSLSRSRDAASLAPLPCGNALHRPISGEAPSPGNRESSTPSRDAKRATSASREHAPAGVRRRSPLSPPQGTGGAVAPKRPL